MTPSRYASGSLSSVAERGAWYQEDALVLQRRIIEVEYLHERITIVVEDKS